ncbi:hypothetical protein [Sinorhizobium meliloti]|uniref:hypothetical protein n=1 Tax=Rhizobium meliloti TaxID=382 RepID=UPI000FDBA5ED|nr:hypothetical protein [Sinorhizobium meliloti]RVI65314.1 hypothetical protein CN189_11875 [Sinorhizobium meliloti]
MSTMIERVARSICAARHDEFNDWDSLDGDERGQFMTEARAVIDAMREPTDEMIAAGDMPDCDNPQKDAEGVYRNMIDAALKE